MWNMTEEHQIVGSAKGEPLPAGRVGVRLRIPLSGSPSVRWSHDLSARLVTELTGHAHVGHLVLNEVVHGNEIVLDGVEPGEAPNIAGAVERAVDATNQACEEDETPRKPQSEADAVARTVAGRQRL
jgi:hypothetical protein